jgi:hypothetical protein
VLGGGEVTLLDHTYAYSAFWAMVASMLGEPVIANDVATGFRTLNPVAVLAGA